MKANYNRDYVKVHALITTLNKINMLLYHQQFGKGCTACLNFIKLVDKYAGDYNDQYEGFGHETALAESLKKQGIVIRLFCLTDQFYQANRERIRFYLGLTAKALLRRRHSKQEVKIYIQEFQTLLARKNWTEGKAVRELDDMLLKELNAIYANGAIERCEV